jgi:hypothetical protein
MAGGTIDILEFESDEGDLMAGYIPINIPPRNLAGPFGPDFFKRKFHTFIHDSCSTGETTTVLEIVLVSGQTLDVSHIEDFDQEYMLVCCFVDERTCESVYHSYIRYDSIFRVNVYESSPEERPLGFNFSAYSAAANRVSEPPASDQAVEEAAKASKKK